MLQAMLDSTQNTSDVSAKDGARASTGQNEPDISKLKRYFEEHRDLMADARKEAETDRDYYDNKQWTDTELRALRRRKQPEATYNLVRVAVDGMVGVIERSQTDPKAWPRNGNDEAAADVATKALRFVADQVRMDRIKTRAAKEYFTEGVCAAIVEVEPQKPDYKVVVRHIHWKEFFADPYSAMEDYSDARYMGIAKWTDADFLKGKYPAKADEIEAAVSSPLIASDSYGDRPTQGWADKRRRRLMAVEIYYKEPEGWMRCLFTSDVVLQFGPSNYLDDQGQPTNPIEAASYAKDRDNQPYGAVRALRSPQDGYNKRQSKLLHMLNVRQTYGNKAALGDDVAKVKSEMAKPDGHIELLHGQYGADFGVIQVQDQVAGQFQLLQEARSQMDRLLPNPGILGRDTGDQSGKAILAQQNAGLTELAGAFGGLTDWELRIYRQMWFRCMQFWQAPRWIRVTDDIGAVQHLQVNVPQMDPLGQQVGVHNALAQVDVDITLDATPESATLQQEQFNQLTQLVQAKFPIPPEVIVQASTLDPRYKQMIIEAMKEQQQQAAQQPPSADDQLKLSGAELNKAKVVETQLKAGLAVGHAEAGGPLPLN